MISLPKIPDRAALKSASLDAVELLRDDPRRFKSLLRSVAELAEDLSTIFRDANHPDESSAARVLSKTVRAAALLPAKATAAVVRKLLERIPDEVE